MLDDLHLHILLMSAVSVNQRTGMRLVGCLQLVLLMALTSRAAGLDIPLEGRRVMMLTITLILADMQTCFAAFD